MIREENETERDDDDKRLVALVIFQCYYEYYVARKRSIQLSWRYLQRIKFSKF